MFELDAEDEAELEAFEQQRGNPEEDYPVLNDHQLRPEYLDSVQRDPLAALRILCRLTTSTAFSGSRRSTPVARTTITQKIFPDLPLPDSL